VDDLKRNKKHLLEKISELELILNSEKEMKQKHLSLLEEEERKNKDLKTFIDNLMKQKEGAIKSELDKSEQIINLESNLIEMERERDVYREENEKNKKIIEEMKEVIKKLTKNVKDLESSLGEEKSGSNKLS
jgi:phosphoglycolate phosphatase-like HAD superfamily hydrolase